MAASLLRVDLMRRHGIPEAAVDRSGIVRPTWAIDYVGYRGAMAVPKSAESDRSCRSERIARFLLCGVPSFRCTL